MIRLVIAAVVVALAVASACTDVSTDPEAITAIGFETVPAPGVVLGDTLRDTTEAVVPLSAQAYNVRGEVIADAPMTFTAVDRGLTIDPDGLVIGDSIRANPARVVASTEGGLQSATRTIDIILRPDVVQALPIADDTIRPGTSEASRLSQAMRVQVLHRDPDAPADSMVRSYLVRYSIVYPLVLPGDVNRAYVSDSSGRALRVDTTDARGIASRVIRLGPCGIEVPQVPSEPPSGTCGTEITQPDSVVVNVTVVYRPDHPVLGSPVRIVLRVLPTAFF
jgi:hypothetical protein